MNSRLQLSGILACLALFSLPFSVKGFVAEKLNSQSTEVFSLYEWPTTGDPGMDIFIPWSLFANPASQISVNGLSADPVSLQGKPAWQLSTDPSNVKVDFRQSANDDGLPNGLGDVHWINSIVQSSNSIYYEGMSNHQRIVLIDIAPTTGNIHSLGFSHQATKGGIHAYDFLTGWDQAIADNEAALGVNYFINECGDEIGPPNNLDDICNDLHNGPFFFDVALPDDPYVDPMDGAYQQRIDAYEAASGNRVIRIYADAEIVSAEFCGAPVHTGPDDGDSKAGYVLTVTGNSTDDITQLIVEFAGHLSVTGDDNMGVNWGPGQGSSQINGGPYHINLDGLGGDTDGNGGITEFVSLGNQDNQIKGADILLPGCPTCMIDGPSGPFCPNAAAQEYTMSIVGDCLDQGDISWSFTSNTSGASFVGGNMGATVQVNPGTQCGTYTLKSTFTCSNCDDPAVCEVSGSVEDTEAPVITACPADEDLGCNPSDFPEGSVTATDNCGTPDISSTLGAAVNTGGCNWTRTRTYTATDACGNATNCVQTYTYKVVDALMASCPGNANTSACLSQDEVDAAFANWLAEFVYSGGCDVTESGLNVSAPSHCGGSITVNYTVTDECNQSDDCSATFTVGSGSALTASCPGDSNVGACFSQAQVDATFAVWLANFSYTGGCNVTESGLNVSAPPACGGSVTVNYVVSDDCNQTDDCSATFTVANSDLTAICPGDVNMVACISQDDVDAAFALWLEGFNYTGGCMVTESGLNVSAPSHCGGSVTVNYVVSDNCNSSDDCSATFSVAPPTLVATCPADSITLTCMNQVEVDAAYEDWLSGFSYTGGCNAMESGLDVPNPNHCYDYITVNYSVSDACNQIDNCTASFTVGGSLNLQIVCNDVDLQCGESIDPSHTGYPTVLSHCGLVYFDYTDGNTDGCGTPAGGSFIRHWVVIDDCKQYECDQVINCGPCNRVCALTQGFYGGKGKFFYQGNNRTAIWLINHAFDIQNGPLELGHTAAGGGGSLTIFKSSADCLHSLLPGGGNPKIFPDDLVLQNGTCAPNQWKKNGRFASVLWGQAVTLWLNTRLFPEFCALNLANSCVDVPDFITNAGVTTVCELLEYTSLVLGDELNPALSNGQLGELAGLIGDLHDQFDECSFPCNRPDVTPLVNNKLEDYTIQHPMAEGSKEFTITPNPLYDEFRLSFDPKQIGQSTSIVIFNQFGQVVMQQDYAALPASSLSLSAAELSAGIYEVAVKIGNQAPVVKTMVVIRQ